jgi:hypothetical protein
VFPQGALPESKVTAKAWQILLKSINLQLPTWFFLNYKFTSLPKVLLMTLSLLLTNLSPVLTLNNLLLMCNITKMLLPVTEKLPTLLTRETNTLLPKLNVRKLLGVGNSFLTFSLGSSVLVSLVSSVGNFSVTGNNIFVMLHISSRLFRVKTGDKFVNKSDNVINNTFGSEVNL